MILNIPTIKYFAYADVLEAKSNGGPTINDPNLKIEAVFKGLRFPSNMAFLGPNDILVLEKNTGMVNRIVNGRMLPQPLLDVNVATAGERGMLGIAIAKHKNVPTYVFLYYTEAGVGNTADKCNGFYIIIFNCTEPAPKDGEDATAGIEPLSNRLYRYELVDNKLVNPKLLLNLSAMPEPGHIGGKIIIGPDQNVYVTVGDIGGHKTQAENVIDGSPPDGTGGILRITQDGEPVKGNILGDNFPLNLYYAYGIRNSFGIDFDPVTGKMWDTENGPDYGDEINLVEPGFNSGWRKVQGISSPINGSMAGPITLHPHSLVDFEGNGKYRAPEFIWNLTVTPADHTVAPTALKFLDSDRLGKQYEKDMIVGDFKNGNLYHFKLNPNRTGLVLNGPVADKIAGSQRELQGVLLGQGFGGISDIEIGPDGYPYVLSVSEGGGNCNVSNSRHCVTYNSTTVGGSIFRIVPANRQ